MKFSFVPRIYGFFKTVVQSNRYQPQYGEISIGKKHPRLKFEVSITDVNQIKGKRRIA